MAIGMVLRAKALQWGLGIFVLWVFVPPQPLLKIISLDKIGTVVLMLASAASAPWCPSHTSGLHGSPRAGGGGVLVMR